MYLFEVGLVVALVIGLVASIAAYFLLARALWPRFVARAEERFERGPTSSVLAGIVPALLAFLVVVKLAQASLGALAAFFAALVVGVALAGASGVAARVGRALPGARDRDEPWRATARGGLVLLGASITPILGWFVIFPLTLVGGLGAGVLAVARPVRAPRALPFAASSEGASS